MSDIDISKALSEEEVKEETPEFDIEKDSKPDSKNLFIMIGVIIGLFVLFFGGTFVYNNYITGAEVVTVDGLHQENIEGNLEEEEGYLYNGYSFIKADGLWWTELNKRGTRLKVPLHFGPKDLEDVEITGTIDPRFNQGENVYIAINPNVRNKYYTLAISELSFNVVKGLDRTPIGSCTEENPVCVNRTIVNCENTQGLPVIELSLEEGPKIELKDTCIKISGVQDYNIVKATNRLLYQWYGVMS